MQGNGLRQISYAQAREDGQRHARAHAADADKLAKRRALLLAGKAEKLVRIFAHRQMGEQADRLAQRGQVVKRAHGHIDLVANAVAIHQHLGGRFFKQCACQSADHGVSSKRFIKHATNLGLSA